MIFGKKKSGSLILKSTSKFKFKNSRHVKPLSGKNLSDELKTNHIYLTGSLNEPSGNHHIEGAQCGLPVIYRQWRC